MSYKIDLERQIEIAHQLPDTQWLLTKGCARQHGHSYKIKVAASYSGPLLPNGMICDFALFKNIIDKYDHQNLNDFFTPTTAEMFAKHLDHEIRVAAREYGVTFSSLEIALSETGKNWVTYCA